MNRIIVLNIEFQFGGTADVIYPVVLADDKEVVLVDCGYTGFLPRIEQAMEREGLSCCQITRVVVTHHDHDHIGALAALKRKYPHIQVVASKTEAPYITGKKKSPRLEQAESMQKTLPEDQKAFGEAFCNILRAVEPAPVDILVSDGDTFDWCGGCEIIATPGHTPGHISLYLEKQKTVVTGDAAVLEQQELVIANPQFVLDGEKAESSLNRIKHLPAETYICYHGGVLRRSK